MEVRDGGIQMLWLREKIAKSVELVNDSEDIFEFLVWLQNNVDMYAGTL